jgi:L-asparaginase
VKHGPNGVWLAFNGRLMHGAALVKRHSSDNDAFREADPAPEMAMIPAGKKRFGPVRLAILSLSPGLPHSFLEAALATLDGAVLRIYGAGTVQNDPCLLATLAAAIGDGRRVVAVSQCAAGGLSPGAYAAGSELWRIGVENGGVLTAEAALVRLWLEMSV